MISVIIPTYNRTKLLMERAIPSLLAQTTPGWEWECLVVGDGTERETVTEMESLISWDKRFRFWNLPRYNYPEGQAAWGLYGLTALNFGLDNAHGTWISVLNDDDEYTPDNFEVLLDRAHRTESEFVYGMSDTWKNGSPTGQLYGKFPPGDGSVTQGAYLYRRSLGYRYRHDCYDRGLNGDADMWTRMWEGGVRFTFIPRVVHHYHRNYP